MQRIFRLTACGLLALFAVAAHAERPAGNGGDDHPAGIAVAAFSDAVKGYAWANQASSASYTPNTDYSYNASGGAITATRSGVGTYAIEFAGLGASAFGSHGGHAQVSAYGSSASCVPQSWFASATNLTVNVVCRNGSGDPVDSLFTVMFISFSGTPGPVMGYAWASDVLNASYTPSSAYSYNGAGGTITATRSQTGQYAMRFAGLIGSMGGGHVQVSAYGSNARCHPANWGWSGSEQVVSVVCFDPAGNPVDSRYTVLFLGLADGDTAYAWANEAGSASYTPSLGYSENLNGPITATRSNTGSYGMRFDGLGGARYGGTMLVSAYGTTARHCTVGSWSSLAMNFNTLTQCVDPGGNRIDSNYTVLVVWPNRLTWQIFADGFESRVD